jgi:hypothetical protein
VVYFQQLSQSRDLLMSDSIEKNNKTRKNERVRPELALLKVFFDAAKDNFEDYFASREEAVNATSQTNIALLGQDLAMAKAYET